VTLEEEAYPVKLD